MASVGVYIINPRPAEPHFYNVDSLRDSFGVRLVAFGELSVVTVAAFAPAGFDVRICDEQLGDAEPEPPEQVIFLTGKSNQAPRARELARHYRSLGKTVVIGGPYATLAGDYFAGACDAIVKGELEEIHERFFADLAQGTLAPEYQGGRADLSLSPVPRWELYPNHLAMSGTLQTSRGCPFSCEFCDVIQYAGQKQRHKTEEQILAELDALYGAGYRQIFLCDDNFTAHRTHARRTLETLAAWNAEPGRERVLFFTQLSIDACLDPGLFALTAEAGLHRAFVGIETANPESLRETSKIQNLRGDLLENTELLLRNGIAVYAGMIVGFDHDDLGAFRAQREFLDRSPIAGFSMGALVAYRSTPLYRRMLREGRIDVERGDARFSLWESNLAFKHLSPEEFREGYFDFIRKVFAPEAFGRRLLRAVELFGQDRPEIFARPWPALARDPGQRWFEAVANDVAALGEGEAEMVRAFLEKAGGNALKLRVFGKYLYNYHQVRFMFRALFEPSPEGLRPQLSPVSPAQ